MNALALYLVLALLCGGAKPHAKKHPPPTPDPQREQWRDVCRYTGWSKEYHACTVRKA